MLQHGMVLSLPWIRPTASEGEEEIHWQTEELNPVLRFLLTLHVSLCLLGSVFAGLCFFILAEWQLLKHGRVETECVAH